ncbi:hypothetical protein F5I97DRAFT_233380 [Phlebopus sp. FC_14]|nr:hypothetical protein F5I97DRAFT_233380 [Phlebopus sp. FC_14]
MTTSGTCHPERFGSQPGIAAHQNSFPVVESPSPSMWPRSPVVQTASTSTVPTSGKELRSEQQEQVNDSPFTLASRQHSLAGAHAFQNRPVAQSTTKKEPRRRGSCPYSSPLNHHPAAVQECRWLHTRGFKCGADISFTTCPAHLVDHGIINLPSSYRLKCMWQGCELTLKRESVVRHVREAHLRIRRASGSTIESSPRIAGQKRG